MSIRRSVANSYDRLHDYERTIQLNYLGAVALILKVLPGMRERHSGHIVNISSMGVQINTPRFSAYVASKNALDGFSRSIASEVIDDGVDLTTVYMPLVRTPMIEPTAHYRSMPSISPEEASTMVAKALVNKPKKQTTTGGRIAEMTYSAAPKVQDALINGAMKLFPGSATKARHGRARWLIVASTGAGAPSPRSRPAKRSKGCARWRRSGWDSGARRSRSPSRSRPGRAAGAAGLAAGVAGRDLRGRHARSRLARDGEGVPRRRARLSRRVRERALT